MTVFDCPFILQVIIFVFQKSGANPLRTRRWQVPVHPSVLGPETRCSGTWEANIYIYIFFKTSTFRYLYNLICTVSSIQPETLNLKLNLNLISSNLIYFSMVSAQSDHPSSPKSQVTGQEKDVLVRPWS